MSTAKNWGIPNTLVQEVTGQVREAGSCIVRAGQHHSVLLVAGAEEPMLGYGSCPGANLLGGSGRCVSIDSGNRKLAGDRTRDNPIRHGRSCGCLETGNSCVRTAADAARVRFHQHIAPILALPKHALENS